MKYISLPDHQDRRLSFYLAMEEFVARNIDETDCFFIWQVEPSVIFGRNQLIENEVNVDYCRTHGIQMYRRKSGGGCVYADKSNLMFSYVTASEAVGFTFYKYINLVLLVLRELGVNATTSGRNDILVDGRKVSGNAFYHIPGRSIVHGTMLYDTDMDNMLSAITPPNEKLQSKGVESIRQHIALLKDYLDISIDQFRTFVKERLCKDEIQLNEADVAQIQEIEEEYLSDSFIYGNNPKYSLRRHKRIEGVGEFEARIELKNLEIKSINLLGDYFLTGELDPLLRSLRGVRLEREALQAALSPALDSVILHLQCEDFISMLLDEG